MRLGEEGERVREVMRRVVMRERVEERVVVPGMRFCEKEGKEREGGQLPFKPSLLPLLLRPSEARLLCSHLLDRYATHLQHILGVGGHLLQQIY